MNDIVGNVFPIISNHYPNVSIEEVKLFDDGHDHYVVLLPNGIAFRFPRGNEYAKKDAVENIFLADFA